MELKHYASNLFAKRDTLDEALEYAHLIAQGSDNPAAVITAVYVVLNTAIEMAQKEPASV